MPGNLPRVWRLAGPNLGERLGNAEQCLGPRGWVLGWELGRGFWVQGSRLKHTFRHMSMQALALKPTISARKKFNLNIVNFEIFIFKTKTLGGRVGVGWGKLFCRSVLFYKGSFRFEELRECLGVFGWLGGWPGQSLGAPREHLAVPWT